MAAIAYAAMQIIPTIVGLKGNLSNEIGTPLMAAGKKAGTDAGKAAVDGLQAELGKAKLAVEKISGQVGAARQKEADAAGKVRVAEAQLQTLREKGITDAGKLTAATEKVATAQRKHETAAKATTTASTALKAAEDQASAATEKLASESDKAKTSVGGLGGVAEAARSGLSATAVGITAVATSVAAAGAGLFAIGSTFANVSNTIRIGTGATGDALAGLNTSAMTVGQNVPASFEKIGSTIADVNTRLGLTGPTLETFSSQIIEAGRMFGSDIDINGLTQAFSAFGVQGADTTAVMDQFFQISQATGVGMNELAAASVKGAPALKEFGFTIGDSAALVGQLDKAGIDSATTLAAMQKGLVSIAQDGKDPRETLFSLVGEIENLTAAGEGAKAIDLASEMFGTRGAAQFVNAVKSGTLGVENFMAATNATSDTILGVAGETRTFSDQLTLFKNQALVAIEPIATRVFGVMTDGMGWIVQNGVPALRDLGNTIISFFSGGSLGSVADLFSEISGGVSAFVAAFRDGGNEVTSSGLAGFLEGLGVQARNLYDTFQASILPALQQFGAIALDVGSVVLPMVWNAFTTGVSIVGDVAGAIGNVVKFFTEHKDIATVLATVIGGVLLPSLITFTATLVAQGIAWVTATASAVAYNVIGTTLSAATKVWAAGQWLLNAALNANPIGLIIGLIAGLVAGIVLAYKNSETFRSIVQGAWAGIQTAISTAWNVIKGVFEFFVGLVKSIGDAATWLWNSAITPAFNGIQAAISFAWGLIQGYFNLWKLAFTTLGDAALWLWNNAVVPAFNGIKAAADLMWSGVTTVFGWFKDGMSAIGDGAMWLWNNAITPAFDGIRNVIGGVIDFFTPLWERFKDGLGSIGDVASSVAGGIKSAFSGVVEVLKTPIHAVGRLLAGIPDNIFGFDIPGAASIKSWGQTLQSLRTGGTIAQRRGDGTLIGPGTGTSDSILGINENGMPLVRVSSGEGVVREAAMNTGGNRIVAALNAGWVPTADFLHGMMQGDFRKNNLGIEEDNPGVTSALGLRSLLVDGDFTENLRSMTGLEEDNPLIAGILGFRSLIKDGDYTGNLTALGIEEDNPLIAAFLGGRSLLKDGDFTSNLSSLGIEEDNPLITGVLGVQDFLRRLPRLADGGIVDGMSAFVNGIYPDMTLTSSFRDGDPGYHGSGMAGDFSNGSGNTPEMLGLANAIAEKYPNSLELIHSNPAFKGNIKNGQNVGDGMSVYGASTMGEHENHVHWAMDSAPSAVPGMSSVGDDSAGMDLGTIPAPEGGLGGGASGSGAGGASSGFSSSGSVSVSSTGGSFTDEQGAVKVAPGDAVAVWVTNWPSDSAMSSVVPEGGSAAPLDVNEPMSTAIAPEPEVSGSPKDAVKSSFAAYGWDQGEQWAATEWIVDHESSWNPEAVNPSSGAFGLFQFLGSTKDQYLPDSNVDPKIQGEAGAKYIKDRYGDPLAAKAFWEQNGWYDQGGLASGAGMLAKKTIRPERVLSPEMTKAFEMLVPHLLELAPLLGNAIPQIKPLIDGAVIAAPLAGEVMETAGSALQGGGMADSTMEPSEPLGGTGVESQFGAGESGNPEVDKWSAWAQDVGNQWTGFFKDNWREMLNSAVGVGLGAAGGGGSPITVNANGQDPRAVTKVLVRSQNRRSRAMQRSGGLTR